VKATFWPLRWQLIWKLQLFSSVSSFRRQGVAFERVAFAENLAAQPRQPRVGRAHHVVGLPPATCPRR
jgi:hypothetical protein